MWWQLQLSLWLACLLPAVLPPLVVLPTTGRPMTSDWPGQMVYVLVMVQHMIPQDKRSQGRSSYTFPDKYNIGRDSQLLESKAHGTSVKEARNPM